MVSTFTRQAGADYFYCSLAYDAAGVPNIAFFDREQDDLKFARPNATGTAFVTELVDGITTLALPVAMVHSPLRPMAKPISAIIIMKSTT